MSEKYEYYFPANVIVDYDKLSPINKKKWWRDGALLDYQAFKSDHPEELDACIKLWMKFNRLDEELRKLLRRK